MIEIIEVPGIEVIATSNNSISVTVGQNQGVPGKNAPLLLNQYSIDGLNFHNDYQISDEYLRTSNDNGLIWSTAIFFKGQKGDQGIQGIQGNDGAQGLQGQKGDKGDKGDSGTAHTFSYPLKVTGIDVSVNITDNLKLTSNNLNTIQDIKTTSSPTFIDNTLTGLSTGSNVITTDRVKTSIQELDAATGKNVQLQTDIESNGLVSGGTISVNTDVTKFDILAGSGYMHIGGIYTRITWNNFTAISTLGFGYTYISINQYGALSLSGTIESRDNHINLGHIYHNPALNRITVIWNIPDIIGNYTATNSDFINKVFGTIIASGFNVTETTPLNINVSEGELWSNLSRFDFGSKTTFTKILKAADIGIFSDSNNPNTINTTQWNNTANNHLTALVTMTTGYWKKDMLVVNPNGGIYYVYGTGEYSTEQLAKDSSLPNYSDQLLNDGNAFLFTIVSQKGDSSIATRMHDVRPMLSRVFQTELAAGGGSVVDYNNLINKPFIPVNHNDLTNRDVSGNHQRLIPTIDSATSIQIMKADGTTAVFNFDTQNETLWIAGVGTPSTENNPKLMVWDNIDNYMQMIMQNLSAAINASSDMVLTRDDGDDNHGYIDMGINSSNYNQSDYSSMPAKAGYIYTNNGKMVIGSSDDTVRIISGGTQASNIVMEISPTSIIANQNLTAPNIYNKKQTNNIAIAMSIALS